MLPEPQDSTRKLPAWYISGHIYYTTIKKGKKMTKNVKVKKMYFLLN